MENESEQLKYKYNVRHLKWLITSLILVGNLGLLLIDGAKTWEDWRAIIIWEVSVNLLALFTFIMYSIFPRHYYVIDEKGFSLENGKGEKIFYESWEGVKSIHYISEGFVIRYKDESKEEYVMCVQKKEAREIYKKIARVREIMDAKKE